MKDKGNKYRKESSNKKEKKYGKKWKKSNQHSGKTIHFPQIKTQHNFSKEKQIVMD